MNTDMIAIFPAVYWLSSIYSDPFNRFVCIFAATLWTMPISQFPNTLFSTDSCWFFEEARLYYHSALSWANRSHPMLEFGFTLSFISILYSIFQWLSISHFLIHFLVQILSHATLKSLFNTIWLLIISSIHHSFSDFNLGN